MENWKEIGVLLGGIAMLGRLIQMGRKFVTKEDLKEHCKQHMINMQLEIKNTVLEATIKGMETWQRKNGMRRNDRD